MCKICKTEIKTEFKSFEDLNSADGVILNEWFVFFEILHLYIYRPKEHLDFFKRRFFSVNGFLDNPAVQESVEDGSLGLERILTASLPLPSAFDDVRDIWLKDFLKFFTRDDSSNKNVIEYQWKYIDELGEFFSYVAFAKVNYDLPKAIAYEMLKTLPHISNENPKFVAYTQNKDKLSRNIQTQTKIGRYLNTIMNNACKAIGCEVPKGFADKLNEIYQRFLIDNASALERVKFAENDDLDEWERVYRSYKITSCMNNDSYGVTNYDTYRCYCTSAFGLDDNGLRLAYIEDENQNPVSRAIVHEPTKTYIKVYGDNVLGVFLDALGYATEDGYPVDLKLAAIREDGGRLYPYVDGYVFRANLIEMPDNSKSDLWVLRRSGDFDLQCTDGTTDVHKCPICGESHDDGYTIYYEEELHEGCCGICYEYTHTAESEEYGTIDVYSYNDTIEVDNTYYLDTDKTREYYGIEYSENLGRYIKITDSN